MSKEGINLFTLLKQTKFTFEDYKCSYNYELNLFLNEYVDNTELFFIKIQKSNIDGLINEFKDFIQISEESNGNADEILDLFQAQLATNERIYEFFELRKKDIELGLNSQSNIVIETKLAKTFYFENNFDNVDEAILLEYFTEKLVKSKYLKNEVLQSYLSFAFDKKEVPNVRFNIDNLNTKDKIIKIFYQFYKEVAGKPRGKQIGYAKLLGEYFNGFDTKTVSSNFSK